MRNVNDYQLLQPSEFEGGFSLVDYVHVNSRGVSLWAKVRLNNDGENNEPQFRLAIFHRIDKNSAWEWYHKDGVYIGEGVPTLGRFEVKSSELYDELCEMSDLAVSKLRGEPLVTLDEFTNGIMPIEIIDVYTGHSDHNRKSSKLNKNGLFVYALVQTKYNTKHEKNCYRVAKYVCNSQYKFTTVSFIDSLKQSKKRGWSLDWSGWSLDWEWVYLKDTSIFLEQDNDGDAVYKCSEEQSHIISCLLKLYFEMNKDKSGEG